MSSSVPSRTALILDPYIYKGVHVSLIGHDIERIEALGQEVVKELDGKVVAQGKMGEEKETSKI